MTPQTRLRLASVPVALTLVAAALTACSPTAQATPEAAVTEEATIAEPSAEAVDTAQPTSGSSAVGDLCALLSEAEVGSIVGVATVETSSTFGSLDEATGGQCVWASTAMPGTFLELAAWPADSINPAPAEAPTPGSGGFVATPGGAYFADATHSFRLAVTGTVDPALEAATQALAHDVQARR